MLIPYVSNIRTAEEREAFLSGYVDGSAFIREKKEKQMPLEVRAALESSNVVNKAWGGGFVCAVEELLYAEEQRTRQGLVLWFAAIAICAAILALVFFYS